MSLFCLGTGIRWWDERERWRLRHRLGRVVGRGSVLLEADNGSGKLLARGESMRSSGVRGSGKPFCRTNRARRRWPGAGRGVLCSGRHRSHAKRAVRDQGPGAYPWCSGWRQGTGQWNEQVEGMGLRRRATP